MVSLGGALWALGGGGPGVTTRGAPKRRRGRRAGEQRETRPGLRAAASICVGDPTKATSSCRRPGTRSDGQGGQRPGRDPRSAQGEDGGRGSTGFSGSAVAAGTILARPHEDALDIGRCIAGQGRPIHPRSRDGLGLRVRPQDEEATIVFRNKTARRRMKRTVSSRGRPRPRDDRQQEVGWRGSGDTRDGARSTRSGLGQFKRATMSSQNGRSSAASTEALQHVHRDVAPPQTILRYSPDRGRERLPSTGQPVLTSPGGRSKITNLMIDGFISRPTAEGSPGSSTARRGLGVHGARHGELRPPGRRPAPAPRRSKP